MSAWEQPPPSAAPMQLESLGVVKPRRAPAGASKPKPPLSSTPSQRPKDGTASPNRGQTTAQRSASPGHMAGRYSSPHRQYPSTSQKGDWRSSSPQASRDTSASRTRASNPQSVSSEGNKPLKDRHSSPSRYVSPHIRRKPQAETDINSLAPDEQENRLRLTLQGKQYDEAATLLRRSTFLAGKYQLADLVKLALEDKMFDLTGRWIRDFKLQGNQQLVNLLISRLVMSNQFNLAVKYAKEFIEGFGATISTSSATRKPSWTPQTLVQAILRAKQFTLALKYIDEFNLASIFPPIDVVKAMVHEKQWSAAYKQVKALHLEDHIPPRILIQHMLRNREWDTALKYINNDSKLKELFPKEVIVQSVIDSHDFLTALTYIREMGIAPKTAHHTLKSMHEFQHKNLEAPHKHVELLRSFVRTLIACKEHYKAIKYAIKLGLSCEAEFSPRELIEQAFEDDQFHVAVKYIQTLGLQQQFAQRLRQVPFIKAQKLRQYRSFMKERLQTYRNRKDQLRALRDGRESDDEEFIYTVKTAEEVLSVQTEEVPERHKEEDVLDNGVKPHIGHFAVGARAILDEEEDIVLFNPKGRSASTSRLLSALPQYSPLSSPADPLPRRSILESGGSFDLTDRNPLLDAIDSIRLENAHANGDEGLPSHPLTNEEEETEAKKTKRSDSTREVTEDQRTIREESHQDTKPSGFSFDHFASSLFGTKLESHQSQPSRLPQMLTEEELLRRAQKPSVSNTEEELLRRAQKPSVSNTEEELLRRAQKPSVSAPATKLNLIPQQTVEADAEEMRESAAPIAVNKSPSTTSQTEAAVNLLSLFTGPSPATVERMAIDPITGLPIQSAGSAVAPGPPHPMFFPPPPPPNAHLHPHARPIPPYHFPPPPHFGHPGMPMPFPPGPSHNFFPSPQASYPQRHSRQQSGNYGTGRP